MDVAVTIVAYKEKLQALGYADNTMKLYRSGLELFRNYLNARDITDLRTVTNQVVIEFQGYVMAGAQSNETKALRIRPVKRLFEYLTRNNQLLINPTEGIVESRRRHKRIGPTLTREELKKLLEQPKLELKGGIRDRALMEVLYATALRIDECLSMGVHDCDLKEGVLFVRKAKGRSQRVVPLGKTAAAFLLEYLNKVRPYYGHKKPDEYHLFINNKGEPMNDACVRFNFKQYGKSAGINTCTSPHTFRRSCATHMLQAGADIRHIQQLLGHKSLATTQQYCKVISNDIKLTHETTHPGKNL